MKFGKYLKQNIEPSIGVENYLDYETLKTIIKNLTAKVREHNLISKCGDVENANRRAECVPLSTTNYVTLQREQKDEQ